MFYIKGKVINLINNYVIIEANNVGYKIYTNNYNIIDNDILYIYESFIDQKLTLYGFLSIDELKMFELLLEINGIGPKTALKILTQISCNDLIKYSVDNNSKELLKVPSINSENYLIISSKIKKNFKNFNMNLMDKTIFTTELYKILKSLGISDANYNKVSFLELENIEMKDKLKQALRIINENC